MRSGVALLFVAGLAACGAVAGSMDAKSEGDQARDQALALFLDRTMTDSVDGEGGDNTDWKYIDIVDKGGLRVDVGMDAPEGLKGAEIELFDEFGKRLDRRLVMPNQTSYSFEVEVDKVPNKYFVRTFTAEGRSTYSIGARLAPDPGQPEPRRVVEARPEPEQPVDEPDPEPKACPSGMTRRGSRCLCPSGLVRSGNRCVEKKAAPVAAPATEAPAPPPVVVRAPVTAAPAPPAAKASVTGSVVRVVPSEDGRSATISIRLDGDIDLGKGARGTLFKNGDELARFTVTKARGRSALATVNASTADLTTGGARLTVRIVAD